MVRCRWALVALLLVAGCKKAPDEQDRIDNATIAANDMIVPEDDQPEPDNMASAANTDREEPMIPTAFQGRWGLVPGDCGPDASIAKGLVTITGDMLRFCESVGRPVKVSRPSPDRLEGSFTFSGEGMDWSKDMVLSLENGQLVRAEKNPDLRYRYSRCPAQRT